MPTARHSDDAPMTLAPVVARSTVTCDQVVMLKHTMATGGLLLAAGGVPRSRLTPMQFDLLSILAAQAHADVHRPEVLRGFVSSAELLSSLPWETADPSFCHLKQLIRRVRRRLAPLGIELQSQFGLGYRLLLRS